MGKQRSALRNRLEWFILIGGTGLVGRLPWGLSRRLGQGLARLLPWLLPGRRATIRRRVHQTLGLQGREADRIVRGAFEVIVLNVIEGHHLARLFGAADWRRHVEVEGQEHLESLLASGEGALLATGHLGCWEAGPFALAKLFQPIWAVERKRRNPLIAQAILEQREGIVAGLIDRNGCARPVTRLVREGQLVAILLDQNAAGEELIIDFLGLPARQFRLPGVLAERRGVAVVPTYVLRQQGTPAYRLVIDPPIRADPNLDRAAARRDVVERISRSLERQVRAHPEQWFWVHDRWGSAERHLARQAAAQARASQAKTAPTNALQAETAQVETRAASQAANEAQVSEAVADEVPASKADRGG